MSWAPDYPDGVDAQSGERFCDQVEQSWGHGRVWPLISIHDAPDDEAMRSQLARFERNAATPAMAAAANRFGLRIDARHALSAISAPTLVVHRSGDPLIGVVHGRYVAEHIRGARMSEFPGDFHFSGIDHDEDILDEIEEFLTGTRQEHEIDRVLKTVVFTDIVGSTDRAVRIGDRRWRALLDAHDSAVCREVERFPGQEVKTLGDGFLASFDGTCSCDRLRAGDHRQSPWHRARGPSWPAHRRMQDARRRSRRRGRAHRGTRRRSRRPRRGARHKH
jgi:hypothetical protein